MRAFTVLLLAVLLPLGLKAQDQPAATAVADTAGPAAADTAVAAPPDTFSLEVPVSLSDTIPPDLYQIVDNLGLNSYTARLIARFQSIPDKIVLEALARADAQTGIKYINAFAVSEALNLFCGQDSLWASFFSDIERQLREPNLLRFNFRDDQKWKSYALDELFYSTFFQELLLVMGNIGIYGSRDGRQWLAGWPEPLRWKFREYRFEYMPEEVRVKVLENLRQDTSAASYSGTVHLQPSHLILPVTPADSVESPYVEP
ncbi:hypothetical protein LLH00_10485 [bacterium]|nr:hypothetical protein [bacterium]